MPKFIDIHPMGPLDAETLRSPPHVLEDEFGVTHHILFGESGNKACRVMNAPDANGGRRHHERAKITCDWISEVESTRG